MLKLLLDEQISPEVGEGLRRRSKGIEAQWLAQWEGGRFLGLADSLLLERAAAKGLTLVMFDRKTIPPLLKLWAETGRDHSGVIFVDEKTIAPSDFGGLIRALQKLWKETAEWDWVNRIILLRRCTGRAVHR
jgi:hypothetical protein